MLWVRCKSAFISERRMAFNSTQINKGVGEGLGVLGVIKIDNGIGGVHLGTAVRSSKDTDVVDVGRVGGKAVEDVVFGQFANVGNEKCMRVDSGSGVWIGGG